MTRFKVEMTFELNLKNEDLNALDDLTHDIKEIAKRIYGAAYPPEDDSVYRAYYSIDEVIL